MKKRWICVISIFAAVLIISSMPMVLSKTSSEPTPINVILHFYTIINGEEQPIDGAMVIMQGRTPPFARRMAMTDANGDIALLYIPAGTYRYTLIRPPLVKSGVVKIGWKDRVINIYVPIQNSTNNQEAHRSTQNIQERMISKPTSYPRTNENSLINSRISKRTSQNSI